VKRAARSSSVVLTAVTMVAALASGSAAAETLQQAWQLAIEHDAALAAAGADFQGALASERAARAARWPSLVASAGYTRFESAPQFAIAGPELTLLAPIFSGDDFVMGNVQMKLPLYTGGRISAGIEAAHHEMRSASDTERVARSSLRLDVAQSYVAVLRAKRSLQAAESEVTSLTAHVADVDRMVTRELVARSDLLAGRVALANAEQERVRADNAVALAYAAYNRRLGESLDRTPDLEDQVPVDSALAAEPLEVLIKRALEGRNEIGALAARADGLDQQSAAERADLRPQLAVSVGYTYLENQFLDRKDFTTVGVGVTWNLFDGGQARNRSAALRSASIATRHRVEDLRSAVELEVREAWLGVREARARVAASGDAVAQAEENLRITRELYGSGLGTNTQVLEAVTLQISAQNNHDNAGLDESLANLKLARAVGAL
jgi:outer membrane protein TolC